MFIEPRFVLVVALCWITFAVVQRRFRSHALAFWSLVFYALYAPRALGLVLAVVVLTYLLATRLSNGRRAKWIVIAVVVGLLAYFKRPAGAAAALGAVDLQGDNPFVPLGFSYLALELMHYAIERSRGRIKGGTFVDFAACTLFFTCRVAGPIKRYNDFTASVAEAAGSAKDVYHGAFRILSGLVKKAVFADALGRYAANVATATTAGQAWQGMLAYSLSLYLDFSAYSDFAIGVSRLMGIRVPENFNWPYLASNIQDFWNRWHMSLSFWVRDYVFTNTGRQLFRTRLKASWRHRGGKLRDVPVVGGGTACRRASVWGAYHALLVTAFHFYKAWLPIRIATNPVYQSRVVSWAGTAPFVLVTVGWVFFRMDLHSAVRVLRLMVSAGAVS